MLTTGNQPSRPAPVPSFSRQATVQRAPGPIASATKRPSENARSHGSTIPRVVEPPSFTTTAPKITRGPASVSARSSSPTLELVELDNDDDIDRVVTAHSDNVEHDSNSILELERLAASANVASPQSKSSSSPRRPESRPATKISESSSPDDIRGRTENFARSIRVGDATSESVESLDLSAPLESSSRIEITRSQNATKAITCSGLRNCHSTGNRMLKCFLYYSSASATVHISS